MILGLTLYFYTKLYNNFINVAFAKKYFYIMAFSSNKNYFGDAESRPNSRTCGLEAIGDLRGFREQKRATGSRG